MQAENTNTLDLIKTQSDTTALAPVQKRMLGNLVRRTIFDLTRDEMERLQLMARMYAASSFNSGKNSQQEGDFFLMMMKGLELGIAPMAAVDTINIIQGKPTLDAKGMLALVKSSGLLESIDIDSTNERCIVTVKRKDNPEQIISFTIQEAQQFKTTSWVNGVRTTISLSEKENWQSMPAVMLKWRAVTKAMRELFPDILAGLYTQEELAPDITIVQPDGSMELSEQTKQFAGLTEPTLDKKAIQKVVDWAKPKYGFESAEQILKYINESDWTFSKGDGAGACKHIANEVSTQLITPVTALAKSKGYIEKDDAQEVLSFIGEENWAFAKLDKQVAIDRIEETQAELEAELANNKTSSIPTWTLDDKETLLVHLKKHFDTDLNEVFNTVPEKDFSHDLAFFANADEAIAKINQVAVKEHWAVIASDFKVVAKGTGGKIEVETPIGTLTSFSRQKFADMLGEEYQEQNELDIANLEPGDYSGDHFKVEWKQSGANKTITDAIAFDPYANIEF